MSIIKSNAVAPPQASGGSLSTISEMNSLRFDGSSYLSRTFDNNGQSIWSISLWVKRSTLQSVSEVILTARSANTPYTLFVFLDDTFTSNLYFADDSIAGDHYFQGRYRDLSSWYHIVLVSEPSNSTVSERLRAYVNGVRKIKVGGNDPSSSSSNWNKSGSTHTFGQAVYSSANPFNGYMANIHFIDGQALDHNSFGETISDIWVPKEYSGTYGTNGFHLDFADANNIGNDVSGRGNHWTAN